VHGHCLIYTSLIETACSRSKRSCHPGLRIVKFVAGAMRIIPGDPESRGRAATSGRFGAIPCQNPVSYRVSSVQPPGWEQSDASTSTAWSIDLKSR